MPSLIDTLAELDAELEKATKPGSIVEYLYEKRQGVWWNRELLEPYVNYVAILAWRIHEDAWTECFQGNLEAQELLARETGTARGDAPTEPPVWFKECLTRACPELALCQDIANEVRHRVSRPPPAQRKAPGVADVRFEQVAVPLEKYQVGCSDVETRQLVPGWRCVIVDTRGDEHDSDDVIRTVRDYWSNLTNRYCAGAGT